MYVGLHSCANKVNNNKRLKYKKKGDEIMEGSKLFWSSGTWLFFVAQGMVVLLAAYLHWYLGKKERQVSQNVNNENS